MHYKKPFHVLVFVLLVGVCGCAPHAYGEKHTANNGEVYYKDGVTKQEAEKLGDLLVKTKYFDGGKKSVQLAKEGNKYLLRLVIYSPYQNDLDTIWSLRLIAGQASREALNGADVQLQICDEHFGTV